MILMRCSVAHMLLLHWGVWQLVLITTCLVCVCALAIRLVGCRLLCCRLCSTICIVWNAVQVCVCVTHGDGGMGPPPPWVVPFPYVPLLINPWRMCEQGPQLRVRICACPSGQDKPLCPLIPVGHDVHRSCTTNARSKTCGPRRNRTGRKSQRQPPPHGDPRSGGKRQQTAPTQRGKN